MPSSNNSNNDFTSATFAFGDDDEVTDRQSVYRKNARLQAVVEDLCSCEPEKIPLKATSGTDTTMEKDDHVEFYDLKGGIDVDSWRSRGLIVREDCRGLVNEMFGDIEDSRKKYYGMGTVSFIVGSPGIGKTRLLQYITRRILVDNDEDVDVLLWHQKNDASSLVLRRDGTIRCFMNDSQIQQSRLLGEREAHSPPSYILIDPDEKGAFVKYPLQGSDCHIIVGCSANEKHFLNSSKAIFVNHYYLGLPSIREVEIMADKVRPDLSRDDLMERIEHVGPVPRYVLQDEDTFKKRKDVISDKAAIEISNQQVKESVCQLLRSKNRNSLSSSPTICGLLFAHVNVEARSEPGSEYKNDVISTIETETGTDISSNNSFSKDPSILGVSNKKNYKEQRISFLSESAAMGIYQNYRSLLVEASFGTDTDLATRVIFEKLCSYDLISGGTFKVKKMTDKNTSTMHIHGASSLVSVFPSRREQETRSKFVRPALRGKKIDVETGYESSDRSLPSTLAVERPKKKSRRGPQFIILSENYPAIDFLNSRRQVFQATMGTDHDMNGWVDLLIDAEILTATKDDNGKWTVEVNENSTQLDFFWVVPGHVEKWKTRKPKSLTITDVSPYDVGQKDVINDALKRFVTQYVLFIDKTAPTKFDLLSKLNPFATSFRGDGDQLCFIM